MGVMHTKIRPPVWMHERHEMGHLLAALANAWTAWRSRRSSLECMECMEASEARENRGDSRVCIPLWFLQQAGFYSRVGWMSGLGDPSTWFPRYACLGTFGRSATAVKAPELASYRLNRGNSHAALLVQYAFLPCDSRTCGNTLRTHTTLKPKCDNSIARLLYPPPFERDWNAWNGMKSVDKFARCVWMHGRHGNGQIFWRGLPNAWRHE